MDSAKYIKPVFSPDEFAGTATYYARFRIPYPPILFNDLIERANPSLSGILLDLASGPGRIAIPLASLFAEVWANDIDSEMVTVGKIAAKKHKVNNIKWFIGKAEELEAESNSFDLITIGEAFHRLDQSFITDQAFKWLRPGGCLAILGGYSIFSGNELWQGIVKQIADKWEAHPPSHDDKSIKMPGKGPEHSQLVLQDKGFQETNSYSFVLPHYWTIASIIGNLYSTSCCSKKVLGENAREFESEITEALKQHDQNGRYFENMRFGYTLGRKPL